MMKRIISLLLCAALLTGFSAYALGASGDSIEEIRALYEQGEYEQAYAMIRSLPPCVETAVLLEEMIGSNMLDMEAVRADYHANSYRAEKMYSKKFFFIRGVVRGFSSSVIGDEDYMILGIEDCSDDIHCYDMTEEDILSVNSGDEVIVAGNYGYDYGWIGIDFRSCSIVDPAYLNATDSIMPARESSVVGTEGVEEAVSVTDASATNEGPGFRFCPNCGEPLVTNGKFCPYCGTKLDGMVDTASVETPQKPQTETAAMTFAGPDEWYKAYEDKTGYCIDRDTGIILLVSYHDGVIVFMDSSYMWSASYSSEYTQREDGVCVYPSLVDDTEFLYDPSTGNFTVGEAICQAMLDHGEQYYLPERFDENWYQASPYYNDIFGNMVTINDGGNGNIAVGPGWKDGYMVFPADAYECAGGGGVYYTDGEGNELYYYPQFDIIILSTEDYQGLMHRIDR